ncbi:MAG: ATP-binding protein [Crocosphaera sp.]|nr:ATP-binding protein [Crocosphaera sp.]
MEIVKQLKQIVIILLIFAMVNVCLLYFQSYQMTKDGRVVNFSGIVRGASQKLIKNELVNHPNDQEINKIDRIIQGLIKGDKSLDLPVVKSKNFQSKINIVQQKWQTVKSEIIAFRQGKTTEKKLLEISEIFWNVTNDATFTAENITVNNIHFLRRFYLLLFAINILVLSIIWKVTKKISRNIMDRIRAEISLKSSEEKFHQLANNINEVFWITDINYQQMIYVSPAYEKIWGKTCQSLYLDINQWKKSIYPEDLEIFNRVLENFLVNQEETFDLEYRIIGSDKKINWIHDRGFVIKNSQNKAYRIAGIAEDITQRKIIEIRLRQELKRTLLLQTITNKIRASLEIETILDKTANIIAKKMNINSCLIYTYSHNQYLKFSLIGKNTNNTIKFYDFLNQLDQDNPYLRKIIDKDKATPINNIKEEPLLTSSQYLLQSKNIKSILTVRTSYKKQINGVIELHQYHQIHHWKPEEINLIESVASRLGIAIAQANLLTENKQQLEKLNEQNRQLQEKTKQAAAANQAKTNFLANMSHEIRTPLNAILGFSDLLSQKMTDPDNVNYLQSIMISGNNLLELINDIFDMVKLESGTVKLQYEPVNLQEIITQIHHTFSQKAKNKNIQLLVDFNENIPDIIEFDKIKLYQILTNLIDNAIKFTKLGSVKITIWANGFKNDLKTHQENCSIIISIQDTGVGISEEKQEIIFDRFTQVSQEMNRAYEGIGLGLTLSQKLVQLLGGTIELDSQLGKGSTFTLNFPNINIIQSSSQKIIDLITEKELTHIDRAEVLKSSNINLQQLSELLEKLYDYQKKSWPKLQQTLSTKEIKKLIALLVNWGQTYQVTELLNYAKKINHALDELDLETLSQLIADFPKLRNTLLNQLSQNPQPR